MNLLQSSVSRSSFIPSRRVVIRNRARNRSAQVPSGFIRVKKFGSLSLPPRNDAIVASGTGDWCTMGSGSWLGQGNLPGHMSAWSKEQLGWLTPVVIDPTVKQKLILSPVGSGDHECYKVLVRPDGSEYFLLENRRKTGFDASLPAEGLLIWRIVANRPILEESHGVEGPAGPRVFLNSVPWPSKNNHSFTTYTTPSSRSQMGGGQPVNITNIRQLDDGRIAFEIGYEFE